MEKIEEILKDWIPIGIFPLEQRIESYKFLWSSHGMNYHVQLWEENKHEVKLLVLF
jgi:hypothetical protein